MEFEKFDRIPRFYRDIIITEKLDGTNGQIVISRWSTALLEEVGRDHFVGAIYFQADDEGCEIAVWAGSRNRWLDTSSKGDNHGFAKWVFDHAPELIKGLGPGRHYGEWYGSGIGRNYGLDHKRFALFNTTRWNPAMWTTYNFTPWVDEQAQLAFRGKKHPRPQPEFHGPPECCEVVPVLYNGPLADNRGSFNPEFWMYQLEQEGSYAVPGYDKPEGIVIFHTASNHLFKVTFDHDEGKWGQ